MKTTDKYLIDHFKIDSRVVELINKAENDVQSEFEKLDDIMAYNQYKVLDAFQKNNISDMHFGWNTGYGYDDPGREAIEKVYANVMHSEAALCRPTIVNGTHGLAITLLGILLPGDELIYCTGTPYDTIKSVIGITDKVYPGSLKELGVTYKQLELLPDGKIDLEGVKKAISPKTKMVVVQRSTGYGWRPAITIDQIKEWADCITEYAPNVIKMVDNSYGEFLDYMEPTDVGVDVMAASLIKNPGGGLALTGAYVAGRADLIDRIQYRMTCPGIGGECGLTFGQTRSMFQGLFIAPRVVNGAVKGAVLCGKAYEMLGYEVCPKPNAKRSDIIEAIRLGSPDKVVTFCEGVQQAAPIDSYVNPIPWEMPGYEDQVVMAAGAFVQGSSIELSADAPIREPYNVYFQGGITYEHSKFGVIKSIDALVKKGLIEL